MTTKETRKSFANPNYDPAKAHEYYMKHRKLKGRKKKSKKAKKVSFKQRVSTDNLNETGLEKALRAKAEMTVKLNNFNKQLKEKLKAEIEKLNGLDENEKAIQIEMLKEKYSEARKQAKSALNEEYAKQMDEIKKDKSMLK